MLLALTAAWAQVTAVDTTSGRPYYILLNDGSHIIGRIIRTDSTIYTVRQRNGQLTYVERDLFKAVSSTAPVSADSAIYYTAQSSRPTAMTAGPGQYVITLVDGTTLRGQVLSQDTSRLVVKTANIGTVYIPANQVVRLERGTIEQARGRSNGHPAEGYPNLFPQYLNFTPTAFQAERGRAYYRNSFIYVNQFDAGITDNWSISAGVVTPFLFAVAGWVGTKVSVPLGSSVRVGVQGQYYLGGFTLFTTETFRASYVQGIVSLGSSQNNVTLGVGTSLDRNTKGSILTVGIVRKVSPLLSFISENQLLLSQSSNTAGKLGAGLRFDRQRHSFDVSANLFLGLFGSSSSITSVGFTPWASYQLRLGR